MIRLGTSGFSYDDWIGEVYPEDLPKWEWLPYYARSFKTVELNVTYYRFPEARYVRGWIDRTPEDFLFSVKAHQSLTHERKTPDFHGFRDSIDELFTSGKLGCILAQFPHSFHSTSENLAYLAELAKNLEGYPVVVEFRAKDWVKEEIFQLLNDLNLGYCCVDEPQLPGLMPPVAVATGPLAYVRFHGRNEEKWWQHEFAWERYDYTYSTDELNEWIPKIQDLNDQAPLTLVYANNHYKGQSVDTINKLKQLLAWEE
ncbi:MAG: hypothetical protein A2Z14_11890 [Chloroflexi bacterium RBG_16_48_8]|nr:MAG: hypothetical protein A2Z14_11890 [Chloroflexi bacterium RBG_16_48_8]